MNFKKMIFSLLFIGQTVIYCADADVDMKQVNELARTQSQEEIFLDPAIASAASKGEIEIIRK